MVRSWEERVKGASTRVEAVAPSSPSKPAEEVSFSPRLVRSAPAPAVSRGSATFTPSSTWLATYDVAPLPASEAGLDLALAHSIEAAQMPVVVLHRASADVVWASTPWLERFGYRDSFSRYAPTSTDFGEAPLPPPGESWQRTRTMILGNGGEDLVELLLLGSTHGGTEFVTVMARDRLSSTPLVSDLSEVTAVIDGLVHDAGDGAVGVIYIDIDRFKVIHDLVGNLEAQRLVDKVGRRIANAVRSSDLLYRLPGDEFVVLAPGLDARIDAIELAERLRASVAGMSDVGHEMAVTASVGVAFNGDGRHGEAILSDSESAVLVAKERGRNRVAVHDDELRSRSDRLLAVERQLRRAIDQKQVQLAYQPVFDIATGQIAGAEALLRLGRDIGLSAVEVVAAAEQSGLMGVLGALVVDGVREQLGDWLASPHERIIMINVSANQLADTHMLRSLTSLVAAAEVENARVAVEISESAILSNRGAFERLATILRPKVKVGIDSFGTRLRTAADIEDLPVDYVKLHRSVTSRFAQDGDGLIQATELVRDVVGGGRSIVALGVEREEQATALMSAGCTLAQGFYFAGAVTVEELRERDWQLRSASDSGVPAGRAVHAPGH